MVAAVVDVVMPVVLVSTVNEFEWPFLLIIQAADTTVILVWVATNTFVVQSFLYI